MSKYVVLAQFEVKSGQLAPMVEAAKIDAKAAVANEPGCRRFDVLVPRDGADRVVLYEIYDDEAAFQAHLETPHLKAFRDAIGPLIESRQVDTFEVDENTSP